MTLSESVGDSLAKPIVNLDAVAADRVFTYRYRQPKEYHFCLDSIIFAGYVIDEVKKRWSSDLRKDLRAADICSGCGVIGFEISHSLPEIKQFDFIEIQQDFRESFEDNLAQATQLAPREFRFLNRDFRELKRDAEAEQYDLIVANPPYFFKGEGILSPSQLKNRCRFFLDGSLRELIEATVNALSPGGVAYLLVKSGSEHGRNVSRDITSDVVRDLQSNCAHQAEFAICATVRGTSVLHIARHTTSQT